ncbi:BppU family phage baseplate upper protein [Clostridium gasigenes]|uniref:BppU family phage baseplate upper protein n=1 Tax=Clostridium gasigenes TaxID=94869 RepID=UPI001623F15B|nr:BppU family phage baseplate upper protein [Clostridium gasigenes]MBB6622574.1 BppU family phage baseplate upper protein [Clostridium gasigenes]
MIKFDKSRKNYEVIKKKQYDTLEPITVAFYNNNIPINLNEYTFRLECLKADNTIVIQMDNIIKKNINELEILLIPQITSVSGEAKCQIVLFKNGLQDSTFTFCINVDASVLKGGIASGNVITILDTLLAKIAEAESLITRQSNRTYIITTANWGALDPKTWEYKHILTHDLLSKDLHITAYVNNVKVEVGSRCIDNVQVEFTTDSNAETRLVMSSGYFGGYENAKTENDITNIYNKLGELNPIDCGTF